MTVLTDLDDVAFHLRNASYFNKLWHESMEIKLHGMSKLSAIEQNWQNEQTKVLLQQKISCQVTALDIAYQQAILQGQTYQDCQVVLELDEAETGVSGEGVYYSLYPKGRFDLACHIPKDKLADYLTQKQRAFFNLDF